MGWAALIALSAVLGVLATIDAWPGRTRKRRTRSRHPLRKRTSSRKSRPRARTARRKKG